MPRKPQMQPISPEALAKAIEDAGLSHSEVGRRAQVSRGMVGHLCSGLRPTCSRDLARRLSRTLGLRMDALFVPATPTTGQRSENENAA